ncbi:MAG: hypothetical protein ACRCY3_13540, partial [Sphingorhabdus sp.]
ETVVMSQAKPVSPAISAFVLTILAVFALIYTIGYEQFMGFVQLFVDKSVDREVFGWTIPATWYPQLVSVFALIIGGRYIMWMNGLADSGRQPSVPVKFAIGLFILTLALGVLMIAVGQADPAKGGQTGSSLIVLSYLLLTLSEIVLWPLGFATVERLAPAKYKAAWLGVWLLCCASLGSYLAGLVGAQFVSSDAAGGLLMLMGVIAGSGVIIALIGKWLVGVARDPGFSGKIKIEG